MYFLDKIIKSDFGEIFIAKDEEQETYFMAKNICHILELVDEVKRTVSRLDDDEHILIKRNNITPISCMKDYLQAQNLGRTDFYLPKIPLTKKQFNTYGEQFITKSGLYHLVLTSRSTKAKDLKCWIMQEINTNFSKTDNQIDYITSCYCGLDKIMSKSAMPLEAKYIRQKIVNDYNELKDMNDKFNLGLDVYQTLKTKYNIK